MEGLDRNREYLMPVTTNEEGVPIGAPYFRKGNLGKVLWLFSSEEKANKCFNEPNDETRDVLRDQERIAERNARELGYGRSSLKITVPDLLPWLEQGDIDHVILDPGFQGWYQRVYRSPHKA